jgi:hypothetical protein
MLNKVKVKVKITLKVIEISGWVINNKQVVARTKATTHMFTRYQFVAGKSSQSMLVFTVCLYQRLFNPSIFPFWKMC